MPQLLRHAVECLSDAASDGGEGVAVATEGHRRAESVFKIRAFKKRSDSAFEGGFGRLWGDIYV